MYDVYEKDQKNTWMKVSTRQSEEDVTDDYGEFSDQDVENGVYIIFDERNGEADVLIIKTAE